MRTRDAFVLAAICIPPQRPRAPGHKLRHAVLMRVIGARRRMKLLERRGYLEPGWSVDYLGVHCQVTEIGGRVARAVGAVVALESDGGPAANARLVFRLLLNLRFRA